MDFKNWLIALIILILLGASYFFITGLPIKKDTTEKKTESPAPTKVAEFKIPPDWKEYKGLTVSFFHPSDWEIENIEPFGGAVIESIKLNIPGAIDSNMFYSATVFDLIRPDDIMREQQISINKREWTGWVRENEENISYDFFTKETPNDTGSFVVHARFPEIDDELEQKLINLIKTINFESAATEGAEIREVR